MPFIFHWVIAWICWGSLPLQQPLQKYCYLLPWYKMMIYIVGYFIQSYRHDTISMPRVYNDEVGKIYNFSQPAMQGRAETFGGAGAQSIKGAHGTRLLIGLCSLLICASKWMLLYWYSSKCHDAGLKKKHRTEKTILSLNVKDIFCT